MAISQKDGQNPYSPSSIAVLHGPCPTIDSFKPQIESLYQQFMENTDFLFAASDAIQDFRLEEVMPNLARLLHINDGEVWRKLVATYKIFPLRGGEGLSLSNEVLDYYARFDLPFVPGGWLPFQKIGPTIVFIHFLPNTPRPKLPNFFQAHCITDYQTYNRLYTEFMHYDQPAVRKEYNLTTNGETFAVFNTLNKLTYQDMIQHLLALTHQNGPEHRKLSDIKDATVSTEDFNQVLESLIGRVGPEYDLWFQAQLSERIDTVKAQLGIPSTYLAVVDPRYLVYGYQEKELNIPLNRKKWLVDNKIIPIYVEGSFVLCAGPTLADTAVQHSLTDNLRNMDVGYALCTEKAFHFIDSERKRESSNEGAIEIMRSTEEIMLLTNDTVDINESIDLGDNDSTKDFVKRVIANAIEMSASDIHLEMTGTNFRIRYRIDGILRDMYKPFRAEIAPYIVRVIKGTANMNITETRMPIDGRARVNYRGRGIDLRIATCPVEAGGGLSANDYEKCVIRILDAQGGPSRLEDIIWNLSQRETVRRMIDYPYGMIVITGPTGSGKTTTIATLLTEMNTPDINIMTAEDPVERKIPGINQVMISEQTTYPLALRSFLRMDPDVILVGEIRDEETAELAVKASQTGHLVLTTLHANNAVGVISRFRQLRIKPHDIASTVLLMTAQRLIRQLCQRCRIRMNLTALEQELFKSRGISTVLTQNNFVYSHRGCSFCAGSGYKGRVAVMEMIDINDEIRTAILRGEDESAIASLANKYGFKPMYNLGLEAVSRGATDIAATGELVASIGFGEKL